MTISIVLPAYREADNLKCILPKIHEELHKLRIRYEVLVIDTMEVLDETMNICSEFDAVCVRRQKGNLYGDAIRTGILESKGKYIVVMDADGSHDPHDIVRFYKEIRANDQDLIIGSRYCRGGCTENIFILRVMSRILNFTYRVLFRIRVKDISNSYRMYKADKLKSVKLECDNFDIVEEILIKLCMKYPEFKIEEIPIYFNKREFGESKRDLWKFIISYLGTIHRLLNIKKKAGRTKY